MTNMKKISRKNYGDLELLFIKGFSGKLRIQKLEVVPRLDELRKFNYQQTDEKLAEWAYELNAAKNSAYYWWWAFLKESHEYQAAFRRNKTPPEVREVAKDFGDLFRDLAGIDFGYWWFQTGRYLFAQQRAIPSVKKRNDGFLVWNSKNKNCIYLEVPLAIRKSSALRQINEILSEHFKGKDERRHNVFAFSTAKRDINKRSKMRLSTFKQFYDVWQDRKHYPESEWWETGERLKISPAFINTAHTNPKDRAQNNRLMTLTVQRIYRKTEKLIYYAARGDFPRVK